MWRHISLLHAVNGDFYDLFVYLLSSNSALCADLDFKGKKLKRCFYWKSNASFVIVYLVVNVTISIRSIGRCFFSTMLGKKYTGRHPWCMIFIGCKINICVFSFIKEGELSLLVQRMKFALSFCVITKLGALHTS